MKQTAVEWLVQEINKINVSTEARRFINKLEKQAKEIEKQQQGYSEEEVLTILHKRDMYEWEEHLEVLSLNEWFEQFKNK